MDSGDTVPWDGMETTGNTTDIVDFVNKGRQKRKEMSFRKHSDRMGAQDLDEGRVQYKDTPTSRQSPDKSRKFGEQTPLMEETTHTDERGERYSYPFVRDKFSDKVSFDIKEEMSPHLHREEPYLFKNDHLVNSTPKSAIDQGSVKRRMMNPDTYNGESNAFEDYIAHFELVAQWNKWTDEEKAIQLGASLRGVAQKVLGDAPLAERLDYDRIKIALQQRFAPKDRQAIFKTELRNRKRKRSETLREYGYAIRRLVGQAFPTYGSDAQEEMAIDYFIQGLTVGEVKIHVQLNHPTTLEAAISHAFEYESLKAESHQAVNKPHSAVLHEDSFQDRLEWQNELSRYKQEVNNLKESLSKLMKAQNDTNRIGNSQSWELPQSRFKRGNNDYRSRPPARGSCFNCGNFDHYIADCPFSKEYRNRPVNTKKDLVSNRNFNPQRDTEQGENKTGNQTVAPPEHEGYFLEGKVGGKGVHFLVDTGSSYSIINEDFYSLLPDREKPKLQPFNRKVRTVSGDIMPSKGWGTFSIEVVGQTLEHPFVVSPVLDPALMGVDLIKKLKATVDVNTSEIAIKGIKYPLFNNNTSSVCARVEVGYSKSIPAQHEAQVLCKIKKMKGETIPLEGIIEPNKEYQLESGLLVSSAIVNTSKDDFHITVINPHPNPVRIKAREPIATFQSIENVIPLRSTSILEEKSTWNNEGIKPQIPEHLQPLLDKAERDLTGEQKYQLADLLVEYQDIFLAKDGELGCTSLVEHKIDTRDAKPIKQPPRRVPLAQKSVVEEELNKMLKQGIIETSDSAWSSPVVLVKKKDGGVRFCVDYRRLNTVTKKDAYPLPRIGDCLDSLAGSKWFSTLDLASGYWQVPLDKRDKDKAAFVTHKGLFNFKVLPFGLCNAPATFERLMERVLQGLQWQTCLVYIDDIIVFGKDFRFALMHLKEVFERLRQAHLKLKPKKCSLFGTSVSFLGHIVSRDGIHCDPSKIDVVRDWPSPNNLKELRSFLGLCSYYRRFIKDFAEVVVPLVNLTRKRVHFRWDARCEKAFNQIKEALTQAPILAYPISDATFILDTDASSHSVGAVLSQIQHGEEKVIAYASRTLRAGQRNYCTTKRELLAVIIFVKYFRHYLWGQKFHIRTDHASLTWLTNFKEPEGMLARWISILDTYDYQIEHRPGSKHGNADGLSRKTCHQCKRDECTHPEQVIQRVDGKDLKGNENSFVDWCKQISNEKIKHLQGMDLSISKFIALLQSYPDRKPAWHDISRESREVKAMWVQWHNMFIENGLLYRRFRINDTLPWCNQLVAPIKLRKDIMRFVHDKRLAGHLGVNKTLHNVRSRFYWVGHKDDVKRWCRKCWVCASRKPRPGAKKAPLQQKPTGDRLERIAMDILGPLPQTVNGNIYILVASDYFSKWTQAWAIPDHTAMTIADKLVVDMFLYFGSPLQIHTDQGRDFESKLFRELCHLLETEKTHTVPYRPQSDGQVERFNRTLLSMLSSFVNENQDNWDDILPYVMSAYRSTVQESTQCSPNLLFLGHEIRMPVDVIYGRTPREEVPSCPHEYVEWVRDAMGVAHTFAREQSRKTAERQKTYYDIKAESRKYKKGDWVWYFYPPIASRKLARGWTGPFMITQVLSDVNYKIQETPSSKPRIVHIDQIKTFEGDPPYKIWLSSEEVDTEIGVSELPETVTQTSEDSVITVEGNDKEIKDRQVREDEAASNIEPEVIECGRE